MKKDSVVSKSVKRRLDIQKAIDMAKHDKTTLWAKPRPATKKKKGDTYA